MPATIAPSMRMIAQSRRVGQRDEWRKSGTRHANAIA